MKTFQTLTIRNLDSEDKEKIVKIMNDVADYYQLNTGQAIIEKAIIQYDWLKYKLEAEQEVRATENQAHKARIRELEQKVSMFESSIKSYKEFQQIIADL